MPLFLAKMAIIFLYILYLFNSRQNSNNSMKDGMDFFEFVKGDRISDAWVPGFSKASENSGKIHSMFPEFPDKRLFSAK